MTYRELRLDGPLGRGPMFCGTRYPQQSIPARVLPPDLKHGCGDCLDFDGCRAEGYCVRHIEIVEPDTGRTLGDDRLSSAEGPNRSGPDR